jgi:hypothetical protein
MELLRLNAEGQEGTFLYELHENSYFHLEYFLELIREVKSCSQLMLDSSQIEIKSDLITNLFKVYSCFSNSIMCHFNPNDLYEIKNFDIEFIDYNEDLEIIVSYLIQNDYKGASDFLLTSANCSELLK